MEGICDYIECLKNSHEIWNLDVRDIIENNRKTADYIGLAGEQEIK
jgi:hypothetical protein